MRDDPGGSHVLDHPTRLSPPPRFGPRLRCENRNATHSVPGLLEQPAHTLTALDANSFLDVPFSRIKNGPRCELAGTRPDRRHHLFAIEADKTCRVGGARSLLW